MEEKDMLTSPETGNDGNSNTVCGDISKKERLHALLSKVGQQLPTALIYARYALPLITALTLLVMGFFHNVFTVSVNVYYRLSLWKLYLSTVTGTHAYLGGELSNAKSWFYGLLSTGAIVCAILFLVSLFLSALALYTAVRAFRAGHYNQAANRYKVIFKVAFPNRIWLFVANALVLIPAAFPYLISAVGQSFLSIGTGETVFVRYDFPLIVMGVLTALTLVLACVIPRYERRREMNMFLVYHPAEENEGEEDEL
jgi:hypothetical protein